MKNKDLQWKIINRKSDPMKNNSSEGEYVAKIAQNWKNKNRLPENLKIVRQYKMLKQNLTKLLKRMQAYS